METIITLLQNFLMLLFESAPWLLLGFFISGIIKFVLPPEILYRHLGQNNVSSVIKGAIIGAPLPLCSCSVIPVALGIRRSGASKASTSSFLIASPETGVDSIAITYALLGPFMAIIRPIAAVTTAILTGLFVMLFDNETDDHKVKSQIKSCCSDKKQAKEEKSCCTSGHKNSQKNNLYLQKLKSWFRFSFVDLIKDTAEWLTLGILISALVITFVPSEFLQTWGASSYAYFVMAIIGVPMYICATSSTPIAVGLLFAGVSPGAILVFLLAGPATNVATLAIVKQELGKKVLVIYLSSLVLISFIFGWITDYLANFFHIGFANENMAQHSMGNNIFSIVCGIILLLLMSYAIIKKHKGSNVS